MAQAGFAPAPETEQDKKKPAVPATPTGFAPAPETPETPAVPAGALPIPAELKAPDRGVWASIKRTAGMPLGLWRAATAPATSEEQTAIEQERPELPNGQRAGVPWLNAAVDRFFGGTGQTDIGERLRERLITEPRQAAINQSEQERAQGLLGSAAVDRTAAELPLLGPLAVSIAHRWDAGDRSGAITDVLGVIAAEKAPGLAKEGYDIATGRPQAAPVAPLSRSQMIAQVRNEGITRAVQGTADQVAKALPPSKSAPWTPEDYQNAKPYIDQHVDTVGGNGVERFRDTLDTGLDSIEGHLRQMIAANPQDTIEGVTPQSPREYARQSLAGSRSNVDSSFVEQGMKDLERFNLDNPTVQEADDIRWKINQENKGVRLRNHYDQATAAANDPAYAAREAAADALRDGVYGKLEQRGMPGAAELRQTEGSLIKLRNAAEKAFYSGDKTPPGSGGGLSGKVIRMGARKVLPGVLADAIGPDPLTRNQLLDKAMAVKGSARPALPMIPPAPEPAGLLPAPSKPPIVTPPPAGPPDTSGTPAVPETGPQKIHPLPPRTPPNAAGQADVTAPAPATGGTMTLTPKGPELTPGQKLLPQGETERVTGGPGTKGVPLERPPKAGNGATPAPALKRGISQPKAETGAANQPAVAKATAPGVQNVKPLAGRVTLATIQAMTDPDELEKIIIDPSRSKALQDAAWRQRRSITMQNVKPEDRVGTSTGGNLGASSIGKLPKGVIETTAEGAPLPKEARVAVPREKTVPVAQRHPPEIIKQAEFEMQGAKELAENFERPARYHLDLSETTGEPGPTPPSMRNIWYGVKSSKHIVAEQYPWFAKDDVSLSAVNKAIEKGKGADYERIVGRIADGIAAEKESAKPIIEANRPELQELVSHQGLKEADPFLHSTLEGLLAGEVHGIQDLPDYIKEHIADAKQAAQLSEAIEPAVTEARDAAAKGAREPGDEPEASAAEPGGPADTASAKPDQGPGRKVGEGILPGMAEHVEQQRAGAAKVQGLRMGEELQRPLGSIDQAAGEMERSSPLFRGTEASPQKELLAPAPTAEEHATSVRKFVDRITSNTRDTPEEIGQRIRKYSLNAPKEQQAGLIAAAEKIEREGLPK